MSFIQIKENYRQWKKDSGKTSTTLFEDKRDKNMDGISRRIIGDSQAYKMIPYFISCHTKRQTIPVLLYTAAVSTIPENCNVYW